MDSDFSGVPTENHMEPSPKFASIIFLVLLAIVLCL